MFVSKKQGESTELLTIVILCKYCVEEVILSLTLAKWNSAYECIKFQFKCESVIIMLKSSMVCRCAQVGARRTEIANSFLFNATVYLQYKFPHTPRVPTHHAMGVDSHLNFERTSPVYFTPCWNLDVVLMRIKSRGQAKDKLY